MLPGSISKLIWPRDCYSASYFFIQKKVFIVILSLTEWHKKTL